MAKIVAHPRYSRPITNRPTVVLPKDEMATPVSRQRGCLDVRKGKSFLAKPRCSLQKLLGINTDQFSAKFVVNPVKTTDDVSGDGRIIRVKFELPVIRSVEKRRQKKHKSTLLYAILVEPETPRFRAKYRSGLKMSVVERRSPANCDAKIKFGSKISGIRPDLFSAKLLWTTTGKTNKDRENFTIRITVSSNNSNRVRARRSRSTKFRQLGACAPPKIRVRFIHYHSLRPVTSGSAYPDDDGEDFFPAVPTQRHSMPNLAPQSRSEDYKEDIVQPVKVKSLPSNLDKLLCGLHELKGEARRSRVPDESVHMLKQSNSTVSVHEGESGNSSLTARLRSV